MTWQKEQKAERVHFIHTQKKQKERERERERERQADRDRERDRDRQTDRETETETESSYKLLKPLPLKYFLQKVSIS